MAACLIAASPQAQAMQGVGDFRLLKLDGRYLKWGAPVLGTGATVTYAFLTEDMHFAGARNCGSMTPMTGLKARFGIPAPKLRAEAAEAFRIWQEAANIVFAPAADAAGADILIGAQAEPVGRAFTNVAYKPDGDDIGIIDQALICLNPEQPWKVGFDGDIDVYDLRYTIAHEIGHAIGLDHPSPFGQMMSFRYDEEFRSLQDGDRRGVEALYGSRSAPLLSGGWGENEDVDVERAPQWQSWHSRSLP